MLRALELLYALGALDEAGKLTRPLGALLAELPVPPQLGRALLCAGELRCVQQMLTVAACLQVQSLWLGRAGFAGGTPGWEEARARFAVAEGDHVTALNAYSAYAKQPPHGRHAWCARNALSSRALARVADVRRQLAAHLAAAGVVDAPPPQDEPHVQRDAASVRRALTAGFFAHAAKRASGGCVKKNANVLVIMLSLLRTRALTGAAPPALAPRSDGAEGARYVSVRTGASLWVHPSSVLHRCAPEAVLYDTALHTDKLYMRDVAAISLDWLPELAPHFYEKRAITQ